MHAHRFKCPENELTSLSRVNEKRTLLKESKIKHEFDSPTSEFVCVSLYLSSQCNLAFKVHSLLTQLCTPSLYILTRKGWPNRKDTLLIPCLEKNTP